MKIYINGSLKELNVDNVTISALIVTLNLTVKRMVIEKCGEILPRSLLNKFCLAGGLAKKRCSANPSAKTTAFIT